MAQSAPVSNPFMLLLQPEVVIAAMERSERLGQLNRRLCRPLDKQLPRGDGAVVADADNDTDDEPVIDADS